MTTFSITIRPLCEPDLPEARRILRLAFGTHAGAPDPENLRADIDFVGPRWRADATAAFAAEVDGRIVGSNFAVRWGTIGFFGPLTVHPDFWNHRIGQHLMKPVVECFEKWKVTQSGLFTFADSAKHLALYQKFGFWPRFLTALMTKEVRRPSREARWSRLSELSLMKLGAAIESCYRLTNAIYPGLDVSRELLAVHAQNIGDTVLLWKDDKLAGFAVCHCGRDTEAGDDHCYIKFGAAEDSARFDELLDACESFAASRHLSHLDAGMNLARHEAYRQLLSHGFRLDRQGVAMHCPDEPAYSREGIYVMDDWR